MKAPAWADGAGLVTQVMEERNEVDSVAEESSQLVRSKCTTGNRDISFSLRDLLNGQLMGPYLEDDTDGYICWIP